MSSLNFNNEFLLDDAIALLEGSSEIKLEHKPTRDAYGKAIVEIGQADEKVVTLNADLEGSVRLAEFTKQFPKRSIQVGVAEQNMALVSLGLALYGKIPFMSSFASFSPGLNYSQIRLACISNANVKVASSHYGINIGEDGLTAQMLEDVSMMRVLPNMKVITPADYNQTIQAVWEVYKAFGPMYIRFTRGSFPIIFKPNSPFQIGKGQILKWGTKLTLVCTGSMVFNTLKVAAELEQSGISVEVINIHTVKPLDEEVILESARKTGKVIVIEEHQKQGGLGSAIAVLLGEKFPCQLNIIAIDDEFGESGPPEELYKLKGLDVEGILAKIKAMG